MGSTRWGRPPTTPETLFHVKSQMFGASTLAPPSTCTLVHTSERCQTEYSLGDGCHMYWEPLRYSVDNVLLPFTVGGVDSFSLNLKLICHLASHKHYIYLMVSSEHDGSG